MRSTSGRSARTATRVSRTAGTRFASSSIWPRTRSSEDATRSSRSAACSRTTLDRVAAVAARLGLRCVLVQERWVEWPDVVYDRVGNILLSRIMGADVRLDPSGFDIGIRRSWEDALASVHEAGGKPYAIPAGASDHPLGGLGFVRWADEVAEQERERGIFFDTVVVCSVTGSTQAGMIAGFAAQDTERAVIGIDGSATVAQTRDQIARIARFTAEAIGLGRDLDDSAIILLDEWHAGTYGIPDEKTVEAIRLCARLEGMLTDPVYEGKSMAAVIDRAVGTDRSGFEGAVRPSRWAAGVERVRRRVLSGPRRQVRRASDACMAFIAAVIAMEKLRPWRRAATWGTAAMLLTVGVLVLVAHDLIPGLAIPGDSSMPQHQMSP